MAGSMGGGFQPGGTVDTREFAIGCWCRPTWMQTRSSMKLFNASVPYFPDTPIKMNHRSHENRLQHPYQNLSLIPYIGVYGSINFNGKCDVKKPYYTGETNHWKPMDGYSYIITTTETDIPYEYEATIDASRRWDYGAVGGMKQ